MTKETKVINLIGAPGAGKSTCRAGLFYLMKINGYDVEEAFEWIKYKLYEDNEYVKKDQLYVFAKQRKQIEQLQGKVEFILTDSPLCQSVIYGADKKLNEIVIEEFKKYNNYIFYIERNHKYSHDGRYQNEGESQELGVKILEVLRDNSIEYTRIGSLDAVENIYRIITENY